MESKTSQDALLWGLVGCGGILFLVLIGSCGFGMYLVASRGLPDLGRGLRQDSPPAPGTRDVPPPPADDTPGDAPPKPPVAVDPDPPKPPPGGGGLQLVARVTSVTGSLSGRVLTSCEVHVEPPDGNGTMCHALVVCDGLTLYGDASHGFFQCSMPAAGGSVSGNDGGTTSADGDAAFTVDTSARVLRLRDDSSSPNGEYALEGTF